MTYKEIIEIRNPNAVSDRFMGGVVGCPVDYNLTTELCTYCTTCEECWNREVKGVKS